MHLPENDGHIYSEIGAKLSDRKLAAKKKKIKFQISSDFFVCKEGVQMIRLIALNARVVARFMKRKAIWQPVWHFVVPWTLNETLFYRLETKPYFHVSHLDLPRKRGSELIKERSNLRAFNDAFFRFCLLIGMTKRKWTARVSILILVRAINPLCQTQDADHISSPGHSPPVYFLCSRK